MCASAFHGEKVLHKGKNLFDETSPTAVRSLVKPEFPRTYRKVSRGTGHALKGDRVLPDPSFEDILSIIEV